MFVCVVLHCTSVSTYGKAGKNSKLKQIHENSEKVGISETQNIEILDLECVLCHVTGVQNENKNALINPPS